MLLAYSSEPLPSLEMESAIWVQILDEAVNFSFSVNAF